MDGILLVGHGSLRADSAEGMRSVAQTLQTSQEDVWIEAGFLNYGTPTLAEAAARMVEAGVGTVVVQPYFLVQGQYVVQELSAQVFQASVAHPDVKFITAKVVGSHPGIPDLIQAKVQALGASAVDGLMLVAHGSRYPEAVRQVERLRDCLRGQLEALRVEAAFLEINAPDPVACCGQMVRNGCGAVAVAPYFLHAGRHAEEDLPALIERMRAGWPEHRVHGLECLNEADALAGIVWDLCQTARGKLWGTTLQTRLKRWEKGDDRQSLFGGGRSRPSGSDHGPGISFAAGS